MWKGGSDVSCHSCGRNQIDRHRFAWRWGSSPNQQAYPGRSGRQQNRPFSHYALRQGPVDRILDLDSALLAIKEEDYLGEAQKGPLDQRLSDLLQALVTQVEKAHNALNKDLTIPKLIKAIRALIRRAH